MSVWRCLGRLYLAICVDAFCTPLHAETLELDEVLAGWSHDAHADLRSILVVRNGKTISERYYNGETADTLHDIRSAGKSITALLVGAAADRHRIRSVKDKVEQYWPEAKASAIGDVSIDQVLSMRSGLAAFDADPESPGNEDKLDDAADPIAFTLGVPRDTPPGTQYRYNSLTAYIAGLIVERSTGQDMENFARSALFSPLGIDRWQWGRDSAGHPKGQGNLSLTTRDLAKIGQLVLDKGMFNNKRVISAAWIDAALEPRVDIRADDPYADGYAYFWYAKTQVVDGKDIPVFFASGNGGNKIYVIPSQREVVVVTSSAYGHGYGQRRSENILKSILAVDAKQGHVLAR